MDQERRDAGVGVGDLSSPGGDVKLTLWPRNGEVGGVEEKFIGKDVSPTPTSMIPCIDIPVLSATPHTYPTESTAVTDVIYTSMY